MLFEERFLAGGRFAVDGVGLDELLIRHATPFYVYSATTIRDKLKRLRDAFPGFDVCYSLKANPNRDIVRILARDGAGAEISSAGELAAARAAGVKPEDIVFVGPAKSEEDISAAVSTGIYALVVDSRLELEVIDAVARRLGRKIRVMLRINTLERQPEAKEVMVGGPSKFGFDEETVVSELLGLKPGYCRIEGVQVYSASQVLEASFIAQHIEYVAQLARKLSSEVGFELRCIDFGGGFGIPYAEDEEELDVGPAAATARQLRAGGRLSGGCRVIFEVGRYLAAEAGVFITRVVRVKESRGRLFAICDAGMNAFARPVLMRIRHPIRLLSRIGEPLTAAVDVCGPICTPLDCIGKGVRMPRPVPGDIVGVFNAGAYGYTMSPLDFMSLGRPAELVADSGSVRVIRKPAKPA